MLYPVIFKPDLAGKTEWLLLTESKKSTDRLKYGVQGFHRCTFHISILVLHRAVVVESALIDYLISAGGGNCRI